MQILCIAPRLSPTPTGVSDVLHLYIKGQGGGDDDDGGVGADEFLRVGGTQVGTREANYAPVRHLARLLPTKILVSANLVTMVMMMIVHF